MFIIIHWKHNFKNIYIVVSRMRKLFSLLRQQGFPSLTPPLQVLVINNHETTMKNGSIKPNLKRNTIFFLQTSFFFNLPNYLHNS